ncbi:uncharacterized protein LOC115622561 [Scaptodrosophila lebanonensis]|uniref:Uncharacterized protein LOC115622561 n=1 Tax=Drosophila lebanonensis TaxID=7225 RepID=A0A6J2TAR0_DROLE|nr:uncharacterized protein LOC115622561 [Scaptodrosophila lebanonensis]
MPFKYQNYKYTCLVMMLLRILWSASYLWVMVHGAMMVPVLRESWQNRFWTSRMKYLLAYTTMLPFSNTTEFSIFILIFLVLFSIFRFSRCRFSGSKDSQLGEKIPLDFRIWSGLIPYLIVFLFCWALTTLFIVLKIFGVGRRAKDKHLLNIYCQLGMALLFKLLLLSNMTVVCCRSWGLLMLIKREPDQPLYNFNNFGDHLNAFFRI